MSASDYKRSASEFQVNCTVADCLRRWLKPGWKFGHYPSGEERPSAAGARLKRMGAQTGWPDLILFSPAPQRLTFFLELKRATRSRQSDEQIEFEAWCVEQGYPYVVARSVEEALLTLRHWGALRV